jgi:hypothetical protein
MDVATRVTPYPIQTINRGDALREAMQIAEHDGYPLILLRDDLT